MGPCFTAITDVHNKTNRKPARNNDYKAVYWLVVSVEAVIMVKAWNIAGHVVEINGFKLSTLFTVVSLPVREMTLLIDHKQKHSDSAIVVPLPNVRLPINL